MIAYATNDFRWIALTAVLGLLGWVIVPGSGAAAPDNLSANPTNLVRIGIAPGTWSGINRNDASAAISAWAKAIMKEHGNHLEVRTRLFESDEDLNEALQNGQVDAVTLLAQQFLALKPELQPDSVFLAVRNHEVTERYVLLVNRDDGLKDLKSLRGGRLLFEKDSRCSLAGRWVDTLLTQQTLPPAPDFFKTRTPVEKPSKAVLQVFFHQAEACLVTSNVFALVAELNPQVSHQLHVLAISPEVIPAMFYFRPSDRCYAREVLEPAILSLHNTVAGQQVLTVFQCERMVKRPIDCLAGTRELLEQSESLSKSAAVLGAQPPQVPGEIHATPSPH